MHYLMYRLKESNGFIAKRAQFKALMLVTLYYGASAYYPYTDQILTPEMMAREW